MQRGLSGLDNGIPGGAFHLLLQPVEFIICTVLLVWLIRQPVGLLFALQPDLFHGGFGDTDGICRPGLSGSSFLLDFFRGDTSCFLKWNLYGDTGGQS